MDDEIPLAGGNTHDAVVRVGSTVRRPTGEWTPAVHALLLHLERRGFDGAPRVLGIDEQGREILTFVPGTVVHHDELEQVDDSALAEIAACIRRFHDAVATFPRSPEQRWSGRGRDPTGGDEILCHNDLAPWNLVRSSGHWVFIDWDLAAPGRLSWDLAWALQSLVPLAEGRDDTRVAERVRIFCGSYGLPRLAPELIDVAAERCRDESGRIEAGGRRGEEPYARLLAEGHADWWSAAAGRIESRAGKWKALLAR